MSNFSLAVKIYLGIFFGVILIGGTIVLWSLILGPAFNNADYSNYNSSPQHMNAVAQVFSRDCEQIASSTDPNTIKAIEDDIVSYYNTVDINKMNISSNVRNCVEKAVRDEN